MAWLENAGNLDRSTNQSLSFAELLTPAKRRGDSYSPVIF